MTMDFSKQLVVGLMALFSSNSMAQLNTPLCDIPESYLKLFELKDLLSFSDYELNDRNALMAKKRIAQKQSFIVENDLNIIKGNQLQIVFLHNKKRHIELDKTGKNTFSLNVELLESNYEYCEFIIHTRKIDW